MDLAQRKCVACEAGMPPLSRVEAEVLLKRVDSWLLAADSKEIQKSFKFKNFAQALSFVNKIGAIAEDEGHHPDIEFGWGYVNISLSTHAIKGLSENDFIIAAKIDAIQ